MNIKIQTILILGLGVLIGYFIGSNVKENSFDDYIKSTMYFKSCVNRQSTQVSDYCSDETVKAYPQVF